MPGPKGYFELKGPQGAEAGAASQLVFRPGAAGPLPAGVYSDWATLYAAAILAPGPLTIYLDNTFVTPGPIVIPAGNWDFPRYDVTLAGARGYAGVGVNLDAECTLNGVIGIDNFLIMVANNALGPVITGPLAAPTGAPLVLKLGTGVQLINAGTAPFIELISDGFFGLALLETSAIDVNTVNLLASGVGTTGLYLYMGTAAAVAADAIRGDATAFVIIQFAAASKLVDFTNQPNFLGTLLTDLFDSAGNMQYLEAVLADWGGTPPGTIAIALDRIAAALGPIP